MFFRDSGRHHKLLLRGYVQYFDSVEDLVEKLCRLTHVDVMSISEQMQAYNDQLKAQLTEKWQQIMQMVAEKSPNHSQKLIFLWIHTG